MLCYIFTTDIRWLMMLEGTCSSAGQLTTLTLLPSHEKSMSFNCAPLLGHTQQLLYQKWSRNFWTLGPVPKTRVHTVVHDDVLNTVAGIEQCGLPSNSCAIHTLQLAIKGCILAQCSVSDILARCQKIVGHYKHSHLAVERLQYIKCQLSLPNYKFM